MTYLYLIILMMTMMYNTRSTVREMLAPAIRGSYLKKNVVQNISLKRENIQQLPFCNIFTMIFVEIAYSYSKNTI